MWLWLSEDAVVVWLQQVQVVGGCCDGSRSQDSDDGKLLFEIGNSTYEQSKRHNSIGPISSWFIFIWDPVTMPLRPCLCAPVPVLESFPRFHIPRVPCISRPRHRLHRLYILELVSLALCLSVTAFLPESVSSFVIVPSRRRSCALSPVTVPAASASACLPMTQASSRSQLGMHRSNNDDDKHKQKLKRNQAHKDDKYDLQLLLVDHYDSYTYNLYDMLANLCTVPPIVLPKDFTGPLPDSTVCDAIILSPGPGRPSSHTDMGRTLDLIRHSFTTNTHLYHTANTQTNANNNTTNYIDCLPILGVCLGHQALAHVHGAVVRETTTPVHGQVHEIQLFHNNPDTDSENAEIYNDNNPIFDAGEHQKTSSSNLWVGLPTSIHVTRYHSLAAYDLPESLRVTAMYYPNNNQNDTTAPTTMASSNGDTETESGVIMGLQHKTLPHYGVQFHPESIGTTEGYTIVENFLKLCHKHKQQRQHRKRQSLSALSKHVASSLQSCQSPPSQHEKDHGTMHSPNGCSHPTSETRAPTADTTTTTAPTYHVRTKELTDVAVSPLQVFETLYASDSHAVWLDSSRNMQDFSRYSIMAGMTGPLSKRIDYYGMEHQDELNRGVFVTGRDGKRQKDDTVKDILEYLEQHQTAALIYESDDATTLPFVGGHLGYLGYEVRHDTQRKLDKVLGPVTTQNGISNPSIPTAAFLFCDQCIIFDHGNDKWYLVELTTSPEALTNSDWMSSTAEILRSLLPEPIPVGCTRSPPSRESNLQFTPNRSRSAYQADIADCHEQIRLGESYELCLTNQLETIVPSSQDQFQLYKILRQQNPSPFAAYFNFQGKDEDETAKVTICCSSPERFISVQPQDGQLVVEAKPIKGTAARPENPADDEIVARELHESIKNRAENLMIVDLLRNDLNRVCMTGSVHVPKLMAIESYATVHQMVSTIRGMLQPGKTNIDVLTSCFPGGSMTGAPKRRTMEILHEMEERVSRGPYSGSLGYLSLNGRMDMNIVIRSIVLTPCGNDWKVSIGAGGAITALSESDDEYEEMLLKAQAVKQSVEIWAVTAGDIKHSNGKQTKLCKFPATDPIELKI